jgi:hypothetical protein
MKKNYRFMALIMLSGTISAAAYAVDLQKVAPPATPPAEVAGTGMHHGMGMMGMGGMMAGMTDEDKDKHMRGMQEHMLKMHDLSNQILSEKDPAKKEQLKNEQLKLMKAHHEEHHAKMMEHRMEHRKEMRNTSPK